MVSIPSYRTLLDWAIVSDYHKRIQNTVLGFDRKISANSKTTLREIKLRQKNQAGIVLKKMNLSRANTKITRSLPASKGNLR